MLAYKIFGAGIPGLVVDAMARDVADALTATGTNQATAYHCTTAVSAFGTVASGTGARLDAQATKGDTQMIYNGGTNALLVYPPVGATIGTTGTNTAVSLATGVAALFHCISATLWAQT